MTKIYLCFVITIYISIYIFIIQFYFFLIPGLYNYENIKTLKFIIIFLLYNIIIIIFFINFFFPKIWLFFNENNILDQLLSNINFYFEPKFNEYFSFFFFSFIYSVTIFYYIFFLYFYIFLKINDKKIKVLINFRKFFYSKFLLISFIFSLPDFISQIFIFLFLVIIFEILILFSIYKFLLIK